MAKKTDKDYDWNNMSLDRSVEEACSFMGCDGVEHGVMTSEIVDCLLMLGHPGERIALGVAVCALADTRGTVQVMGTGKRRKLIGVTWTGNKDVQEQWNRHLWHLPLWAEVHLTSVL
jgi:hypothetical protein